MPRRALPATTPEPGPPSAGKVRVTHLQRRSFPGHYSMERVFAQVRACLPERFDVDVVVTAHYNRGVLPRLRTMLEARHHQAAVTHVTGDINYATLLLRRRTTVLTVHDTEFLQRASGPKRALYRWLWLRLPVWRAGLVTVPSTATRDALLAEVRVPPSKIRVIPNPVSPDLVAAPPPSGPRPTVLLVGTRPNKNVHREVAALAGLDCRVVVIGLLDDDQRHAFEAAGLDYEGHACLSDESVRAAYAACDLLLFASTAEGFGIPILEAQASGRPVVTSNRPPMSTVAGGGACLVDPLDVGSIRAGVQRVLSDARYRAELVRQGGANAARYRVDAVAADYAALYDEVASRR